LGSLRHGQPRDNGAIEVLDRALGRAGVDRSEKVAALGCLARFATSRA
jgi:hypothetical protein